MEEKLEDNKKTMRYGFYIGLVALAMGFFGTLVFSPELTPVILVILGCTLVLLNVLGRLVTITGEGFQIAFEKEEGKDERP